MLCLHAVPAQALMLGQPQGALWLGRVAQLRIPVRMDPGLPLAAECVQVGLVDGDARVPQRELHVSVRAVHARTSYIEVRSQRALRSPFVRLSVSMQCQFGLTRQYTLLVEPPPVLAQAAGEPASLVVDDARASARGSRTAAVSRRAPAHRARHSAATRRSRHVEFAARAAASRSVAVKAPSRSPSAHAQAQVGQGSRLHMEWLSGAVAPAATPRASSIGAGASPAAHERAAEAARGTLPAALPAPDAARLAELQRSQSALTRRVDALQVRLDGAQRVAAARQRDVDTLRSRLADARSRTPRWWNAALGSLAALCALLALLLWQRREVRVDRPWGAVAPARPASRDSAAPHSMLPLDAPPTYPPPSLQAPSSGFHASAFQRPLSPSEQVQIDEVVDQRHVADFFMGLGDYDKAIDVMRRAVAESAGGSGVVPYLYLFELYRRADRRADYEQLRDECASRLNARIPSWDEEPDLAQRDLLEYPRALALLQAAWDTPSCLTVIERMIAGDPRKPRVGFELPAYRDLLDLYALAREPHRALPAEHAADGQALELDLELDLAGTHGASSQAAEAPARDASADDETPTLQPLEFTLTTQPASTLGG